MTNGGHEHELRTAYWEAKLAAQKDVLDVVRRLEAGDDDFVLLDARNRDAYEREHLPGALSTPLDSVATVAETLPPEREYVVYCWRST
jgi:rhodanese-related sulfurtransferase